MTPYINIIDFIADEYQVTPESIVGRSRNKEIVIIRHIAIGVIRRAFPRVSLRLIGKIFNRDHSTVIHALSNIDNAIYPNIEDEVKYLAKTFLSPCIRYPENSDLFGYFKMHIV